MKKIISVIFICLIACTAFAEDEIQWKKYSKGSIGGTIWGVSFQIVSSWKVLNKPDYSIFSNSPDCLVYPLTKWCSQRSLLMEIKKNEKTVIAETKATEKTVKLPGAKNGIAYKGAYTFRFLTPDGKYWVLFSGKGASFDMMKKTIRLNK